MKPTSGQRAATETSATASITAFQMMPGRNASSAFPLRSAKNAAMAVGNTADSTYCRLCRWTTRTTARTTVTTTEATIAGVRSLRHTHSTTKATVGRAVSTEPRQPPRAVDSRCRISSSTVGAGCPGSGTGVSGHAAGRSRRTG